MISLISTQIFTEIMQRPHKGLLLKFLTRAQNIGFNPFQSVAQAPLAFGLVRGRQQLSQVPGILAR